MIKRYSNYISNEHIITQLYTIVTVIAFFCVFIFFPDCKQIIKFITYISFVLIILSIRYSLFENERYLRLHLNQFFVINIFYLHKILSTLTNFTNSLKYDRTIDKYAANYWIGIHNDFLYNSIIFSILCLVISGYLFLHIQKLKILKHQIVKTMFLTLFYFLSIFIQVKIAYLVENYF